MGSTPRDPGRAGGGRLDHGVGFLRIRGLVHAETGIALSDSKRQMVCSRLGKRLRFWGYTNFGEYWEHLRPAIRTARSWCG